MPCVTRQRWAQIKGLCQDLMSSAPMFVLQSQGLHDLLACAGAALQGANAATPAAEGSASTQKKTRRSSDLRSLLQRNKQDA